MSRLKEIQALSKSNYFDYAKDEYLSKSVMANMTDELLQMVGVLPCYYKWNGGEGDCKSEGIQEWDFCPVCLIREQSLETVQDERDNLIAGLEFKARAYDAMCKAGLIQFNEGVENPIYSVWGFTCWHHDHDIIKAIGAANEPPDLGKLYPEHAKLKALLDSL